MVVFTKLLSAAKCTFPLGGTRNNHTSDQFKMKGKSGAVIFLHSVLHHSLEESHKSGTNELLILFKTSCYCLYEVITSHMT